MDNGVLIMVVGIVGGLVLLMVTLFLYRLSRGAMSSRADAKKEATLKEQVREKAKAANTADAEATEDLTDSGIISVLQMMDALMSGGKLEEAEEWALHAIQNHPNRVDVPLKLAEIYHRAGRKSAYVAIVNNLADKGLDIPQDDWSHLIEMGREIAPGDPLFR